MEPPVNPTMIDNETPRKTLDMESTSSTWFILVSNSGSLSAELFDGCMYLPILSQKAITNPPTMSINNERIDIQSEDGKSRNISTPHSLDTTIATPPPNFLSKSYTNVIHCSKTSIKNKNGVRGG